jgi:hypothetical protein
MVFWVLEFYSSNDQDNFLTDYTRELAATNFLVLRPVAAK